MSFLRKGIFLRCVAAFVLLLPFNLHALEGRDGIKTSFVAFPTADPDSNLVIPARLNIPVSSEPQVMPAVVIAHSSAGVESTGSWYGRALNRAGFVTLELDMWSARGLPGGADGRPNEQGVPGTIPDAFGALQFLAALPYVDKDNIGIIGFSWGGGLSLLSATQAYTDQWGNGLSYKAHVANYPVCWIYYAPPEAPIPPGHNFTGLTGSPVLIQSGDLDGYESPESCENLIATRQPQDQAHISLNRYPYATHAWDRFEPNITVNDPAACFGQGCDVEFKLNFFAAWRSKLRVLEFFRQNLQN